MTEILIDDYSFQVEPFVRYKENRLKGKLTLTSGEEMSSLDMAIVRINQQSMNVGGIARIPLVETWGFVLDNPDNCILSTLIALRFDLKTPDFEQIYHLDFVPFQTDMGQVFKLNVTGRYPKNQFEKYALEVAEDIRQSEFNFCHDENLKHLTI
jgi:hypothetical protein